MRAGAVPATGAVRERDLCGPEVEAELRQHEEQGRTVTLLASDKQILAIVPLPTRSGRRRAKRSRPADTGCHASHAHGDNVATAEPSARRRESRMPGATCSGSEAGRDQGHAARDTVRWA